MIKRLVCSIGLLSLFGCSAGPSESDIDAAVQKLVEQQNKEITALGSMMGGTNSKMLDSMKVEAPKVKKIGCKEDGENAYLCDVELTNKQGTNVAPMRLVKGSGGWVAAH